MVKNSIAYSNTVENYITICNFRTQLISPK